MNDADITLVEYASAYDHLTTFIPFAIIGLKANGIWEDILIAEFDIGRIRAYREPETWSNACRKPATSADSVHFEATYKTNEKRCAHWD